MSMILVLCTVPDLTTARSLADTLLTKKLAACVGILPGCESHYVWEGKRETTTEVLLQIKTPGRRWRALRETLQAAHPYAVPEIIRIDVTDALPEYLSWLHASTRG
jgi:periplasmic divalent cation tolerance protein